MKNYYARNFLSFAIIYRVGYAVFSSLFVPSFLFGIFFANPAQPNLQTKGLIQTPSSWYCLRIGYVSDHVYRQAYKDECQPLNFPSANARLVTDASLITINFGSLLDLNLLVGSSQLQIDHEIFTKREFSWAAGGKLLFFQNEQIYCAFDLKYFETNQKPLYFVAEGVSYNVLSRFKLEYIEIQAALGLGVRSSWMVPYAYVTYLYSKIDPTPLMVVLKYPFSKGSFDTTSRPFIDARRWGMSLGATILGAAEGSLTVETRFFNQNAVTVTGEVRF